MIKNVKQFHKQSLYKFLFLIKILAKWKWQLLFYWLLFYWCFLFYCFASLLLPQHEATITYLKEEKLKLEDELNDLRERFGAERSNLIKAEALVNSHREKLDEQQQNLENLQQKFTLEFSLIANKILDEKSAKFTAQNQSNLDTILNPLKANIKSFEEKVEKVYQTEAAERSQLKGVIFQLMDQSKQIQADANNLTKALKGDFKSRVIGAKLF